MHIWDTSAADKETGVEREVSFIHFVLKKSQRQKKGDWQPREGEGGVAAKEEEGGGQPSATVSRQSRRYCHRRRFCNSKLSRLRFLPRFQF